MLPRLLSAQFGLLDDAVLLSNAEQSLRDVHSVVQQFRGAGRFLPTTVFLRGLTFFFSDFSPLRWYLWSTFQLMAICLILAGIARRYGFSSLQILLSILFFLASPTMVESFYTLSKSEVPMVLLIAGAILLASNYKFTSNRFRNGATIALSFVLLLFSVGTKETTIILPFIFLLWGIISWIYLRRGRPYQVVWKSDMILFVGAVISCILYWLSRSMINFGSQGTYAGGYELFNPEKLLFNLFTLFGWLIRDYPYLFPLTIAAFFIRDLRESEHLFFTIRWAIWMVAWLGILLPWYYLSYYFLPFLFGSALFSGATLGKMLELLRSQRPLSLNTYSTDHEYRTSPASKLLIWGCCLAAFLLFLPSAINATAYGTEQLTFDRANWQIVEQVKELPANSNLFINVPSSLEYFYELELYVSEIYDRPDIKIMSYQPPVSLPSGDNIYIASPIFLNQVLPRVRALNGPNIIEWGRSLDGIVGTSELVYSTRIRRPVLDIGLHRILSLFEIGDMIGDSDRDVVVLTTMDYGWDLWKYSSPK